MWRPQPPGRPGGRAAAIAATTVILALVAACVPHIGGPPGPSDPDSTAIRRDIDYLASDALEGRGTGTRGNDSAAAYIARRYAALGLTPLLPAYAQPFTARPLARADRVHSSQRSTLPAHNVVALLAGRDPALRGQYVIIGAHFDHLGRSSAGALDPDAGDVIRNGADDNASGTAAVMELARLFARRRTRRSLVFVNFTAEELGLLGSQYFVAHSPVALDSVEAMLNFDMVGRLRGDHLQVYGVATAGELATIVATANAACRLKITAIGDGFGPSDHSPFYAKGVPVLHFFTDLHDDYHRASDKADKVSVGGEARVVALAERIARDLGDRAARLTFVAAAAPTLAATDPSGRRTVVYLGSIPDMGAVEVHGVRLAGVHRGSPAERAGLREGDVIVEFDGKAVSDLYGYTDALYARDPGDLVTIVVVRAGARIPLSARLGARGD